MYNFGFVFSNEQYKLLNDGYSKIFTPSFSPAINALHDVISLLENNSFGLPLTLQNSIRNHLLQAQQTLSILNRQPSHAHQHINRTPFSLIVTLSQVALELNSANPNSPNQILASKANSQILQAINKTAKYFENKI